MVLALSSLFACAADPIEHLTSGGVDRTFYVHVPDAKGALPLVLVFHGGGLHSDYKGRNMPNFTGFDALADEKGFIAVYPDGLNGNWGDGRGHSQSEQDGIDDVAFVDAVLAQVEKEHSVDSKRIYATGISNGGFFSQRLACERSEVFAAIGSIAATLPANLVCKPSSPISVAMYNGTADPLVPYGGGQVAKDRGLATSTDDTVAAWKKTDGCTTPAATEDLDPVDDGTSVHRFSWSCGSTAVMLVRVDGGGHTWPGRAQYLPKSMIGPASQDLDATADEWAFFAAHPRP